MVAFAASDDGVKFFQRPAQRFDLAEGAAGVRVAIRQGAVRIEPLDGFFARADDLNIGQAEQLTDPVAVPQRFREMAAGINKQNGDGLVDPSDKVQQDCRLGAERRVDGNPSGKLFRRHGLDQVCAIQLAVPLPQPDQPFSWRRSGIDSEG